MTQGMGMWCNVPMALLANQEANEEPVHITGEYHVLYILIENEPLPKDMLGLLIAISPASRTDNINSAT